MAVLNRDKAQVQLSVLLNLWHGDKYSMGWASPTLALGIARLTKPTGPLKLLANIYGESKAKDMYESRNQDYTGEIRAVLKIVDEGYKLWNEELNKKMRES